MLQTTPKSQWFATTKVCFSLLLHVLCGLAACLYSENQTARSTLVGPGMAGPEERKAGPAIALRASGQETVTSDPVPLANKSFVYLSHREGHKHLGTSIEFAATMKCIERCLTKIPKQIMKIIYINL